MIVLARKEEPDKWIKDAEFAFRVSAVWKGFDLALLYYNGYTDDPAYHRDYLADGRIRFTPCYQHYQAYGFNFAKGFDRATVRGELAVKPGPSTGKSSSMIYGQTNFAADPFPSAYPPE